MERKIFIMTVTSIILRSWPYRPRYIHMESKFIDISPVHTRIHVLHVYLTYNSKNFLSLTGRLPFAQLLEPSTDSKMLTTYSKSPTKLRIVYLWMTLADCLDTKYH